MASEQAGTSILRYREPWKDCEQEEGLWEENWRKVSLVETWAQDRGKAWKQGHMLENIAAVQKWGNEIKRLLFLCHWVYFVCLNFTID